MNNTPIVDALNSYIKNKNSRFHTPGHVGCASILPFLSQALPFDLSEVDGLDSLYEADGIILKSQQNAAALYGAKRTLYSASGSTLAIQAMLAATTSGKKLIIGRNAHRSAINACSLLDITPVYVYPADTMVVTAKDIEMSLEKDPDATAVYITTPDYYGRLCDIKAIKAVTDRFGVLLLVDSAHGAHLAFVDKRLCPVNNGADMVAMSAHKTLPVLTGGAFLHINNEKYINAATKMLTVFGSTSPSYLILSSLDAAVSWASINGPKEFKHLECKVEELRKLASSYGILPNFSSDYDPTRLTISPDLIGISGHAAAKLLIERQIVPEHYDNKYIVFIITPFHTDEDFKKLELALSDMRFAAKISTMKVSSHICYQCFSDRILTPRQAFLSANEVIDTACCQGRISADTISRCPPGIPIVTPGELISKQVFDELLNMNLKSITVVAK